LKKEMVKSRLEKLKKDEEVVKEKVGGIGGVGG